MLHLETLVCFRPTKMAFGAFSESLYLEALDLLTWEGGEGFGKVCPPPNEAHATSQPVSMLSSANYTVFEHFIHVQPKCHRLSPSRLHRYIMASSACRHTRSWIALTR